MSEENLVGGKVNVDKYMTLLQSESDLKVKLQQLFQKMKEVEAEDKAEIARLEELLRKQEQGVSSDNGDSLKLSAEINSLKMSLGTANSKLNSCRNAYTNLEKEIQDKEQQTQELQKMKETEVEDKAEIARLEELLRKQEQGASSDNGDSLKLSAEINSLKMDLETANSKLDNCRNAYTNLEDETQNKAQQIYKLKKELEQSGAVNVAEVKLTQQTTQQQEHSKKDDLALISGVGPKLKAKMYKEGITQFAQIAAWKADDIREFDDKLSFKGRIKRDDWVKQAKELMKK